MGSQEEQRELTARLDVGRVSLGAELPIAKGWYARGIPDQMALVEEAGRLFLQWGFGVDEPLRYSPWEGKELLVPHEEHGRYRGSVCAPSSRGLLWEFIKLHNAATEPDRVLAFARVYGVLGISCRHGVEGRRPHSGWPTSFLECAECLSFFLETIPAFDAFSQHPERYKLVAQVVQFTDAIRQALCWGEVGAVSAMEARDKLPPNSSRMESTEPIEAWIEYAQELRALLLMQACIVSERPPDENTRNTIRAMAIGRGRADMAESEEGLTSILASGWIQKASGLSPLIACHRCDIRRLRAFLVGRNLIGQLALELAAALCSPTGPYECDICHGPYTSERKPPTGKRHHCPACQESNYLRSKREWAREAYRRKHPVARRKRKDVPVEA